MLYFIIYSSPVHRACMQSLAPMQIFLRGVFACCVFVLSGELDVPGPGGGGRRWAVAVAGGGRWRAVGSGHRAAAGGGGGGGGRRRAAGGGQRRRAAQLT